MGSLGLTDIGVLLKEGDNSPSLLQVEFKHFKYNDLIEEGLEESFLKDLSLRKLTINRKTGEFLKNEGDNKPFHLDVEGVIDSLVIVKLPEDNLTIAAVICDSTVRYFFIKCGSSFAFFTKDNFFLKEMAKTNDVLHLLGLDLLKANLQKGKRVHSATTKLAGDLWNRLLWSRSAKDYLKTNFSLNRGGVILNTTLYLNKKDPSLDIISLNGYCHDFNLTTYPCLEVKKTTSKVKTTPVIQPVVLKDVQLITPKTVVVKDAVETEVLDDNVIRGNRMVLVSKRK